MTLPLSIFAYSKLIFELLVGRRAMGREKLLYMNEHKR